MKNSEPELSVKPRYEVLDGLRGVAATMVVAYHLFETYSGFDHIRQIVNHGYLAVDFFFTLSGFVIGYAYDDRWAKGMSAWTFFKRRLIRLHPLLILGTIFGALLFYFGYHIGPTEEECVTPMIATTSPWKMLAVMFLCFLMIPIGKSMDIRGWAETNPLNVPTWSLQWEYLANILYALIIRHFSTLMLGAFVAACGVLTVMLCLNIDAFGILAARDYAAYTVIGGWTLAPDQLLIGATRVLYPFFAGLLLSRLHVSITIKRGGFLLCSTIIVAALAMPYFAPDSAPWVNGIYEAAVILVVFPLVIAMGSGSCGGGGRLCRFHGELSYPLYIMHFPLVYMQRAWVADHATAPPSQHIAVNLSLYILAIAVAWAAYKLYDIPVRQWLSGKRKEQKTQLEGNTNHEQT